MISCDTCRYFTSAELCDSCGDELANYSAADSSADLQQMAAAVAARSALVMAPLDNKDKPADPRFVRQCLKENERGDGLLYAHLHAGRFLHNITPKDGEWRAWNGIVWESDKTKRSAAAVEDVAIQYDILCQGTNADLQDVEDKDQSKKLLGDAKKLTARVERLRSSNGVAKTLYWAPVVEPSMFCEESDFDTNPWLLPCKNGVIDLRTGALTTGRPQDMLTRAVDIDYQPHATCPRFEQFLAEISGDQEAGTTEVSDFLRRLFGYSCTGLTSEQFFFVFVGPGRNGKGILFNILIDILGPYSHTASKAMILKQRSEPSASAASEHLYSIMGKRFVTAAETNDGEKIDEAAVKTLTGSDRVTCRPLFCSEVTFKPTHKLFLQTNHLPTGLTRDFAMLQRLVKIDFPFRYVDDPEAETKKKPLLKASYRKKDPDLINTLRQELPGILAWMVRGCLEWQQVGLAPPDSVLASVAEHATDEDWFGQWFAECLDPPHLLDDGSIDEYYETPAADLHECLCWWWSINRDSRADRSPNKNSLGRKFKENGYEVNSKNSKKPRMGVTISETTAAEVRQWKAGNGGKHAKDY